MPVVREAGIVAHFEQASRPLDLPSDPEEIVACLFDPQRRGELYPLYHQLRRIAPVHRTDDPHMRGVWLVSGFDDAMAVYRNPRAVSDPAMAEHFNHGGQNGPFYQLLKGMMLFLDSDAHARVRRITMKAFTARAIAKLRPVTEYLAASLLDAVWASGQMDLVSEFAYELPIQVIAQLLGVPPADFPVIKEFAYDFARGWSSHRSRRTAPGGPTPPHWLSGATSSTSWQSAGGNRRTTSSRPSWRPRTRGCA